MKYRGFTLIELIVSVAIFAIVVVAVAGAYVSLINVDRQTRGTTDIVNNLSFALDSMSRAIRTGTDYQCGGLGGTNCATTPSSTFTFVNSSGQTITYLLGTGATAGQIGQCIGSVCTASSATYFTDPRITVTTLAFYVSGVGDTGSNAALQPMVTVVIDGTLNTSSSNTVKFSIQTTAAQRTLDL